MTNHATLDGNQFLAGITAHGVEPLVTVFDLVSLRADHILCEVNATPSDVYFPISGLVSVMAVSSKEMAVEATSVGREGIVGLPLFGGENVSPFRLSITIGMEAFRIPHAEFMRRMSSDAMLVAHVDDYRRRFGSQIARTLVCNSLHSVIQRCCRWLLRAADQTASPSLSITQERLSHLLGVRRPTITDAIRDLADRGLIEPTRGNTSIRDRVGLEAAACSCFAEEKASIRNLSESQQTSGPEI